MKKKYMTPQTEVLELAADGLMNGVSTGIGDDATKPGKARELFGSDFDDNFDDM